MLQYTLPNYQTSAIKNSNYRHKTDISSTGYQYFLK